MSTRRRRRSAPHSGNADRRASSIPSVRLPGGECAGLFYPDRASSPVQARHLDYHWDGTRIDLYRDAGTGQVFRVI